MASFQPLRGGMQSEQDILQSLMRQRMGGVGGGGNPLAQQTKMPRPMGQSVGMPQPQRAATTPLGGGAQQDMPMAQSQGRGFGEADEMSYLQGARDSGGADPFESPAPTPPQSPQAGDPIGIAIEKHWGNYSPGQQGGLPHWGNYNPGKQGGLPQAPAGAGGDAGGSAFARYGTGNIPGAENVQWGDTSRLRGFNTNAWGNTSDDYDSETIKNTFGKIASRFDAKPSSLQALVDDPEFQQFFPGAQVVGHDKIDFGDGRPVDVLISSDPNSDSAEGWAWQTMDDGGGGADAGGGMGGDTSGLASQLMNMVGGGGGLEGGDGDILAQIMARLQALSGGQNDSADQALLQQFMR